MRLALRFLVLVVAYAALAACSTLDQAPDPIDQAVANLIAQ